MKEELIKIIVDNLDYDMRVVDVVGLADKILELLKPSVDWAGLDPAKWGELEYTNQVFSGGHWEVDDAGYTIWVDDDD